MTDPARLRIVHITEDFPIKQLESSHWKEAIPVPITRYWTGHDAPAERHAEARLLWSDTAIYVRYQAVQTEPLVVSRTPDLARKTMNLWDRDVCELFIAPDSEKPRRYFEFEIGPTGEWIDLIVDLTGTEVVKDWDYLSGMQGATAVENDSVILAMKIEWSSFGKRPEVGDIWLGNLYRCVGSDPNRGYLAWQPTLTAEQNFHVPEKFGEFEFV